MTVGPAHYAVLSALIFAIGLYGVLVRRHGVALLCALALMFLAPVIALVGFTELGTGGDRSAGGSALALMAILSLGAQLAVGAGMLTLAWRRRGSHDLEDMTDLSA
ncbi:MAG: NADH-quinone oxidoreductase subunit NuoK [Candidatus Dormibacteria bacterium]